MFKFTLRVAASLLLAGLAACVSTPPEVPFDRSASGDVKTIGLVQPGWPDGPSSILAASVGRTLSASMGLLGIIPAMIDASLEAKREKTLSGILEDHRFAARDAFVADLSTALKAHGYAVVAVAAPRKSNLDFAASYAPPADTRVDAYLDVVSTGYGYLAAGTSDSEPYRPFFYVRVRLVRASDNSVLMQDVIAYNPLGAPPKEITLSPDPAYAFSDWDALTANGTAATTGLDTAVHATADAVGDLVK